MPANPRKGKSLKCTENLRDFYENEDEFSFTEAAKTEKQQEEPKEQQQPLNKSRKRIHQTPGGEFQDLDTEDDYDSTSDLEMHNLLNSFGSDVTKTLVAKRKRIQTFTQASLKASTRKFADAWKKQHQERRTQYEEFSKQVMSVLNQWETDLQRTREAEEKLENLYKQQQKLFQQQRVVQGQRLKRVRQLHEDHTKNLQDLQRSHEAQQVTVQEQLRNEISMLQKKILVDTQQEDFASVRRSLQNMLAQV